MLTPEEKKSIIDYRRQKAYDNLRIDSFDRFSICNKRAFG